MSVKATLAKIKANKEAEKKVKNKEIVKKVKTEITQKKSPVIGFDYGSITDEKIREISSEISVIIKDAMSNIKEKFVFIGKKLLAAKEVLPHGTFSSWSNKEFGYSKMHCSRMMRVAKAFGGIDVKELNMSGSSLVALTRVKDEKIFDEIIETAKEKKVTEEYIDIKVNGGRTKAPNRSSSSSTSGSTSSKTETSLEKTADEFIKDVKSGSSKLISGIVGLKNCDVRGDKQTKDVALIVKHELKNVMEAILPFFSEKELKKAREATDSEQIISTDD